jgi:predicted O-methyltransferase YrrM
VKYIVEPRVEQYIRQTEASSSDVLQEMEAMARRTGFPIVGPQVGHLIQAVVAAGRPRRVLELGSGFGYSAIWAASVLPAEATILCTDLAPENEQLAREFYDRAGHTPRLDYEIGDALDIARRLVGTEPESFDFIFNDVDKEWYGESFDVAVKLLSPGGVLMTDNTLWYGYVAEPSRKDEATEAVRVYNRKACEHPNLVTSIVPIRDGVTVSTKIPGKEQKHG